MVILQLPKALIALVVLVFLQVSAPTNPQRPDAKPADKEKTLLPQLARRLEQLETRLKIIEEEQRGGLDLTQFYERPTEGGS